MGINGEAAKQKRAEIAELKVNLKAARDEVQKASTSQQAAILHGRETLARDLAANFEKAKDQFRDAMREKVGSDASEIFATLTSSPEYQGLRINENYRAHNAWSRRCAGSGEVGRAGPDRRVRSDREL